MSGRKHHFIPQLYLRGFLAPGRGARVWQYRRTSDAPFLGTIKDVGAQRDFYGAPNVDGRAPLDDAITEYELELNRHIRYLRSLQEGDIDDSEAVASALIHLIVRARHVRKTMKGFMEQMLDTLASISSDSSILRGWLGLDGDAFNPDLERRLGTALVLSGAEARLGLERATLMRYARYMVRERFDQFHPPDTRRLAPELDGIADNLDEMTEQTHLGILSESLAPERRVAVLAKKRWSIRTSAQPLILPDCVGMSISSGGAWRPALFVDQTDQVGFVVPLDTERCLIGVASTDTEIDLATHNVNAAACSSEFFVASYKDSALIDLMPSIGAAIDRQIEETIASASAEALADLNLQAEEVSEAESGDDADTTFQAPINFQFEGVGAESDAQTIANAAAALIRCYANDNPLTFLHGVTFAAELRGAADNLAEENGVDPVYPSESDLFSSVATYQIVPGALHPMFRPIILLEYGYGLISEDDGFWRMSASILFGALAGASLMQIQHESIGEGVMRQPETALQFSLLNAGADGFGAYYTTRVSAFLIEDSLGSFEDELIIVLERAAVGVVWAHERFAGTDDADMVYEPVREISKTVLLIAARIAARLDAVDPGLETPQGFLDRLRPFGLDIWFQLLRRDLARTYSHLPAYTAKDAYVCVPHFERLLWAMGVVPEASGDGRLRVKFGLLPGLGQ